jgi:hypothetical protein
MTLVLMGYNLGGEVLLYLLSIQGHPFVGENATKGTPCSAISYYEVSRIKILMLYMVV